MVSSQLEFVYLVYLPSERLQCLFSLSRPHPNCPQAYIWAVQRRGEKAKPHIRFPDGKSFLSYKNHGSS